MRPPTSRLCIGAVLFAFIAFPSLLWGDDPNPAPPQIPDHPLSLVYLGGRGDGKTSNTAAFEKAIKVIADEGGGRIDIPAGTYVTGPISLVSSCELHLAKGAVIQFPADVAAYGLPRLPTNKQLKDIEKRVPALISGKDLHDVAITGEGTIDGGGSAWWNLPWVAGDGTIHDHGTSRPKLIVLTNVQRSRIQGVTLRNSPRWNLMFDRSSDLLIEGVRILAPENSPHTDGIDPNGCRNVVIRNCELDCGDDDVAIKAIDAPSHDILVENCRVLHGRGISIGSETYKGIHDVTVRNCTFEGTVHGIHIKSARDRGSQLYNFAFSNIDMKNVSLPLTINLYYEDKVAQMERFTDAVTATTPFVHDVRVDQFTATGADDAGEIIGLPESPVINVALSDLKISATDGLVITDAKSVVLKNVQIHVTDGEPVVINHADVKR
jgi:polygalacturonase